MTGIKIFEKIIRSAEDAGTNVISQYSTKAGLPKKSIPEQDALISLIESLTPKQLDLLRQSVKFCVDLSLFKVISLLENGVGDFNFTLTISENEEKEDIIGVNSSIELSTEFFNWIASR